jgi:hypothetical protein
MLAQMTLLLVQFLQFQDQIPVKTHTLSFFLSLHLFSSVNCPAALSRAVVSFCSLAVNCLVMSSLPAVFIQPAAPLLHLFQLDTHEYNQSLHLLAWLLT